MRVDYTCTMSDDHPWSMSSIDLICYFVPNDLDLFDGQIFKSINLRSSSVIISQTVTDRANIKLLPSNIKSLMGF